MKHEIKLITKYVLVIVLLSLSSFSFAASTSYEEFEAQYEAEMAKLTKQMQEDLYESVTEVVEEQTSYTFHLGGWSYHLNESDYNYNSNHQLMAFEYKQWLVGTFENSFYDRTWLAGYNFKYEIAELEVGAVVGLSYGYEEDDTYDDKLMFNYKGWMPVVFPHISYPIYNSDSLEVRPTVGLLGSAITLTFQLTY